MKIWIVDKDNGLPLTTGYFDPQTGKTDREKLLKDGHVMVTEPIPDDPFAEKMVPHKWTGASWVLDQDKVDERQAKKAENDAKVLSKKEAKDRLKANNGTFKKQDMDDILALLD